jgi:transposase-like protein
MRQADGEQEEGKKVQHEFKLGAVCHMAEELGVRRKLLYQWRDRLQAEGHA